MPQEQGMQPMQKGGPQPQNIFSRVNTDITALNSSILILSQKMKYLIRNEKILGRNLLVINKKLKELQEGRGGNGAGGEGAQSYGRELGEVSSKLDEISGRIARLESEAENIRQTYAKAEQVAEIKYVMDSINPLEFATLKDVKELAAGKSQPRRKS